MITNNINEVDETSQNSSNVNVSEYDKYFTEVEEGLNVVAHNVEATCITSSDDKFSLDAQGNLTVNTITISDANSNSLSFDAIFNRIYPVGSIYQTIDNTDPNSVFTGVWEKIEGVYLVGAGAYKDSNSITKTFTLGDVVGTWEHSHSVPKHNHALSNKGYAKTYFGDAYFYAKDFETGNWTGNARKAVSGSNSSSSRTCTYGTGLGGTTDDKAAVTSGSTYGLLPSMAINIWKRVA